MARLAQTAQYSTDGDRFRLAHHVQTLSQASAVLAVVNGIADIVATRAIAAAVDTPCELCYPVQGILGLLSAVVGRMWLMRGLRVHGGLGGRRGVDRHIGCAGRVWRRVQSVSKNGFDVSVDGLCVLSAQMGGMQLWMDIRRMGGAVLRVGMVGGGVNVVRGGPDWALIIWRDRI